MIESAENQNYITDYIREIENGEIYLDAVLANTNTDLLRRLERNTLIEKMRSRLSEPEEMHFFNERIEMISQEASAPAGYASPHDLPLAIYLFVLERMPTVQVRQYWQAIANTERDDLRSARFVASEMLRRHAEDQAIHEAFLPDWKIAPSATG